MAALDPKELLVRTVISAIAGAVTTTVLVETAERGPQSRKKRRRRKRKKPAPGSKEAKKLAKRRAERARELERRAESPFRRATDELAALPGPGLSVDAFLQNVKSAPSRASSAISGFFSRERNDAPDDEKSARRERKKDGFETLKEEAFYVAKTAVKDKIVEKTGMGGAISAVEKGADVVKKTGADVAKKLKESVPDELGEKVADAGRALSEGGKKLGRAMKESLPDDAEDIDAIKQRLDDTAGGLARWLEGPGAPNYRKKGEARDDATTRPRAAVFARDVDAAPAAPVATKTIADEASDDDDGQDPLVDEVRALRASLDALSSGEGLAVNASALKDDGVTDDERTSEPDASSGARTPLEPDPPSAASERPHENVREAGVGTGPSASETSEPSPPRAASSASAREVFEPREGRPKPRPILRDHDEREGARDDESDARASGVKDSARRAR